MILEVTQFGGGGIVSGINQVLFSSAQLAACMPGAHLHVKAGLSTDEHGFDTFDIAC